MTAKIAFQGEPGAYSHQACLSARPDMEPMPCGTFEDAIEAARSGAASLAALPVENSTYGRVADIHRLLPDSGLHIVDELFLRIHINVLAHPGASLGNVTRAFSHTVLLGQCRNFLLKNGIEGEAKADTAGSARQLLESGDKTAIALASELAGEIYGLEILARNIEDRPHNRTRFLVMAREPLDESAYGSGMMTALVFGVRNIPAALYKAMGGFATNGVNMVKLESYMLDGSFTATQFYADIEGHPGIPSVARALEELGYFSSYMKILGVYPADPRRARGDWG